ncbi:MAG TPA: hypothetical protein DEP63_02530 [Candidatus Magasanikbacteria bacterium]|nr:hypothetical protein [Candidatus Magasanikbacteria bacterium]HCC13599.1 hypothetical protein [Candidatus Magasanikbacteria bacterium]HCM53947.1 hypothetical protein [Candidatus Magasanikbacteria bacterium]
MLRNIKVAILFLFILGGMPIAPVRASTCPQLNPGDRFSVPSVSTAVYVLNSSNERLYFPNSDVYYSWYPNFEGIVSLDTSCVSAYPSANNPAGVNYRPGSRLVKTPLDPTVYVIAPGNERMPIGSEDAARTLFGDNWATLVRDVHDFHWANYVDSSRTIEKNTIPDGMLVRSAQSAQVYYVENGTLSPITLDNSFLANDVHSLPESLLNTFSKHATSIKTADILADPVQIQEQSALKTYHNIAHGFAFQYPRTWKLTDYSKTTNYWDDSVMLTFTMPNAKGDDEYIGVTVETALGSYYRSFTSSQEYIDYLLSDSAEKESYTDLPEEIKKTVPEEEFNAFVDTFRIFIEALLSGISTSHEQTTVVHGTIPALDITTNVKDESISVTSHTYAFWHNDLTYDVMHSYSKNPSNEERDAIKALLDSFTFFTPSPTPEPPRPTASDVRRLSDIKQIQTALELFYTDNDHYPISTTALDLGRSVTCLDGKVGFKTGCDPYPYQYTIMGLVPHDPADGHSYSYTSTASGDSYQIKATLDGIFQSLTGDIMATPSGIRSL